MGSTDITAYRHSPADAADGVNLIVWYESWPPDTSTGDVVVASYWSLRNSYGEFVEFGIALNGLTYKWADDLSSSAHDIQGVITSQMLYILGRRVRRTHPRPAFSELVNRRAVAYLFRDRVARLRLLRTSEWLDYPIVGLQIEPSSWLVTLNGFWRAFCFE
jgi:hypothetical protein